MEKYPVEIGDWEKRHQVLTLKGGTNGFEPGMKIDIDNRPYWVAEVLSSTSVRVMPEPGSTFSENETHDKYVVWQWLFILFCFYVILKVIL